MARTALWIAAVATVLALALGAGVAYGRISDIFNSGHDLGSPGNPTCRQCHIPHKAKALYLWAREPAGLAGMQGLCFSCHDGSVSNAGWYVLDPRFVNHPVEPGSEDRDCNQCHNPHEGDSWQFLRDFTPSGSPMIQNANVCLTCHGRHDGPRGLTIGDISHPVDKAIDSAIDRQWDPYATPPDFAGTRLWNSAGNRVVTSGPAEVKCQTCHTNHGAQPGQVPFAFEDGSLGDIGTLSTMPYSYDKYSLICDNCHR